MVEYLFRTPWEATIGEIVGDPDVAIHVPALCDVEAASVVRRALNAKRVDEPRAANAILDYLDLPIARHGHSALIGRVLQLRRNFSVYDAMHVALAERLNAEFVTSDDSLARAAQKHTGLKVRS
jgi:predicted nucleic acid-binding protein